MRYTPRARGRQAYPITAFVEDAIEAGTICYFDEWYSANGGEGKRITKAGASALLKKIRPLIPEDYEAYLDVDEFDGFTVAVSPIE